MGLRSPDRKVNSKAPALPENQPGKRKEKNGMGDQDFGEQGPSNLLLRGTL